MFLKLMEKNLEHVFFANFQLLPGPESNLESLKKSNHFNKKIHNHELKKKTTFQKIFLKKI